MVGVEVAAATAASASSVRSMSVSRSRDTTKSQEYATKSQESQVVQPGLFLQPFVVSQLVAEVIADMVEGSGVSGS